MLSEPKFQSSKVDIILTNYNKSNFIEEAINTVINQTFTNWKLIIIDDCSEDKSKKYYQITKIIKLK